MDTTIEKYLTKVNKHLKPLSIIERTDIIKEIQSTIIEMQQEGQKTEEILARLGTPKELAKAYLSNLLDETSGFNLHRLAIIVAFYSLAGISGLFIIPILLIITPSFFVLSIITFIFSISKLIEIFIPNLEFLQNITVNLGTNTLTPLPASFILILKSIILYLLARLSWKALVKYCRGLNKTKNYLAI